jgi:hypothetical protein
MITSPDRQPASSTSLSDSHTVRLFALCGSHFRPMETDRIRGAIVNLERSAASGHFQVPYINLELSPHVQLSGCTAARGSELALHRRIHCRDNA